MLSRTAIEDLERLESAGLHPAPADVVRLNVLGLRLEGARKRRPASGTFFLPRLAVVSDAITFREPTVGHELWLARAEQWTAEDAQSRLALYCFALSRDWTDLPPAECPARVKKEIEEYLPSLSGCMRAQLAAAVDWALYGCEQATGVYAALPREDAPESGCDTCVAAGMLNRGRAVLFGHSVADMKSMTCRELSDVIRDSYFLHNIPIDGEASEYERDYFATLDAIEKRLKGSDNG